MAIISAQSELWSLSIEVTRSFVNVAMPHLRGKYDDTYATLTHGFVFEDGPFGLLILFLRIYLRLLDVKNSKVSVVIISKKEAFYNRPTSVRFTQRCFIDIMAK
ncbi:MAG: hypothetical protein WAV01_01050 [Candidatus Saccharimonadales bacterium]